MYSQRVLSIIRRQAVMATLTPAMTLNTASKENTQHWNAKET